MKYKKLINKILNYFDFKKINFLEEQLNYLSNMNGFPQKEYCFGGGYYVPFFDKNKKSEVYFNKDSLESRINYPYFLNKNNKDNTIKNYSYFLDLFHKKRLRKIKSDYVKKLNEISVKVIEAYNKEMDKIKSVFIENKSDGSLVFKFV